MVVYQLIVHLQFMLILRPDGSGNNSEKHFNMDVNKLNNVVLQYQLNILMMMIKLIKTFLCGASYMEEFCYI